jgi:hypothetical protein
MDQWPAANIDNTFLTMTKRPSTLKNVRCKTMSGWSISWTIQTIEISFIIVADPQL